MKAILSLLFVVLASSSVSAWPRTAKEAKCDFLQSSPFFSEMPAVRRDAKDQLIFLTEFSRFMNRKVPELLQEFAQAKKIFDTKKKIARFYQAAEEHDVAFEFPEAPSPIRPSTRGRVRLIRAADGTAETAPATEATNEAAGDDMDSDDPPTEPDQPEETNEEAEEDDDDDENDDDEDDEESEEGEDEEPTVVDEAVDAVTGVIDAVVDEGEDLFELVTDILSGVGDALAEHVPSGVWQHLCHVVWWPLHEEHCTDLRCTACTPSLMAADVVCKRTQGHTDYKCLQKVMNEGFCNYCIAEMFN